jgi:hypothetical protein
MSCKLAERKEVKDMEMTQLQVADQMFLDQKTISIIERKAMAKVKAMLAERNITAQNIFGD